MHPDLLPGGRIQRDDRVVLGQDVHHAVDHERIEQSTCCRRRSDTSRRPAAAYIRAVDLVERGVLRTDRRRRHSRSSRGMSPRQVGLRGTEACGQHERGKCRRPKQVRTFDHLYAFRLSCFSILQAGARFAALSSAGWRTPAWLLISSRWLTYVAATCHAGLTAILTDRPYV